MKAVALSALVVAALSGDRALGASWGYNGDNGADKWPGVCQTGTSQSPIDIKSADAVETPADKWKFVNYYHKFNSFELSNNGHSAKVALDPSVNLDVIGGNLPGKYRFAQFHFHWSNDSTTGSEHTIDGKQFPIEIHLVHYNTKYGDLGNAVKQSDGLAVIGIKYEESAADNPALAPIVDGLSQIIEPNTKATINTPLSLESLLPSDRSVAYRYNGSLTTPDCNEVVVWTVMATYSTISKAQLDKFRALKDANNEIMTLNYRPVQPLNGRTVQKLKIDTACCATKTVEAGPWTSATHESSSIFGTPGTYTLVTGSDSKAAISGCDDGCLYKLTGDSDASRSYCFQSNYVGEGNKAVGCS